MKLFTSDVSALAALVLLMAVSACGNSAEDSAGTTPAAAPAPAAAASSAGPSVPADGAAPSRGAAGIDPEFFQQAQDCLAAAGVTVERPSGMPSDFGSGRPSGAPSGSPSGRPSDFTPGARPSGGASGGPGGGAGLFNNPQAQAALEACGITLPSGQLGGPPSAAAN